MVGDERFALATSREGWSGTSNPQNAPAFVLFRLELDLDHLARKLGDGRVVRMLKPMAASRARNGHVRVMADSATPETVHWLSSCDIAYPGPP